MAALIKSPSVESKTVLLLDPAAHAASAVPAASVVSEPEVKPVVQPLVQPQLESAPLAPPAVVVQSAPAPKEPEIDAYARFMAEHEYSLKQLEDKARQEAHLAGYAEGEKAGYTAGLEKGTAEGAEKYAQALTVLGRIAGSGKEAASACLAEAESLIGAIVFQSVCKIVGSALATPEGVQAIVSQTLAEARRDEVVGLKVSPEDLRLLLKHEASLQPEFSSLQAIGIEADERIALGGCIVQLKGGHIDARIETQFRAFAQSLKDALQERS